jgi:hypothetical protein
MHGLYEPNSVDTTSQFIMKNPHIFGKTNYQTAAVWGTLAEFTATMAVNPVGALPEAFEAMSKAGQDRMLFNKITQSPQYGDNIMAMAEHSGRPWQSVHSQGQRELWNIINKGNYFNNLKANLELHQPFRLQGLTTEDVGESLPLPQEDPAFGLKPTVLVKGKEPSIGIDHEDALEKIGMTKDKHVEGKDFQAGFLTPTGEFVSRETSKKPPYNLPNGHSEDIPLEKRQQAIQSGPQTPYELSSPISDKSLLKKRYDYLNGQAELLKGQHDALRKQIEKEKKFGLSTTWLEKKLDKVGQKYVDVHNQIVELNLGKVSVNDIKEKIGQVKIEDIIKDVRDAQDEANATGFKKGLAIGKEKGRLEEVQRKSAIELYSSYKKKALDEMKKIAANLQRIKDSTEGLPIEYKEELDKILKNFDLYKRTAKTIANRESLRNFIEKANANGDNIKVPEDVIKTAYQTPLNDLTLTQLRDLKNMVNHIYRMGRTKNFLIEEKRLRDLKSVIDEAVKNITGGKGITLVNKFHEDLKKNDPGFWKALTDGAKKHGTNPREYFISNLMPEVQILFLDNIDNGGILYNKLFHPLHEATNTSMDNIDKANKATNDIFNYKKPSDFNKTIPLGNSKIRIDDAMWVYANSANDVQRAHAQATGVSDKDFEEVEKNLSEEDKMAVRKLWQYYADRFKELADLRYELEGVVTKQEDNYFPIQNLEDVSPEEDLLWENTLRSDYRKGGMDKGMLKTRTGGNKAFKKWNFFGTIGRNIDKVEHYIAFAKAIRNANKIINHPDLKAAIVNHKDFGEFYYNSLRKWVSDTARGKFLYETDWFSRLARGTRMNLTSAFLGLNPSPALKQWTGLFYGAEMAGKSATLKMLPKMLFNYKKMSAQIDAESSMMRHASLRQQRELEEMFADRGFFERTGALTAYHKFQAGMMFLTQQSDLIIRRAVYLGTQQALKDQGITDKQHLINEAERVVRRTQPMGGIMYLPDIFRGGEGARQITWLRGHVNKLWNVQAEMVAKMANGKLRMAQMFSQIIMNNLLPCLWLAAVTGTGIFAAKKAKEEGGFVGMEISQMVTGVPLVEDVINDIRSGRKDTNIPMLEYIHSFLDAVNSKNTKKHPNQKLKKTLEFAGEVTGLPVIGAEKVTGWGKDDEAHYKKTSQNQSTDQGIYQ